MTNEFMHGQFERLKSRFGNKAFDTQLCHLIASEVWSMSEADVVGLVNFLIGSKAASRPPLLEDFRNGRLAAERRKLERDAAGAARSMDRQWDTQSLKKAIAANPDWAGCLTAMECIEIERLKIRLERSNAE